MALRKLRQIRYDVFCEECALGDRLRQIARQNSPRAPVDEHPRPSDRSRIEVPSLPQPRARRIVRISRCGDGMMRTLLYEATQTLVTRVTKWSWLRACAMNVARQRGRQKAIVGLARRLAVITRRIWRDGTSFVGRDKISC